jgi:hypothetical protein
MPGAEMTTQPEALYLADVLEVDKWHISGVTAQSAADELRRLHAVNAELLEALKICVCAMQDYQAGIGITEMFDKGERMGRAAIATAEGVKDERTN